MTTRLQLLPVQHGSVPPLPRLSRRPAAVRTLLPFAIAIATGVALLPKLKHFPDVPTLLARSNWHWIVAGVLFYALTYLSATVALHAVSRQRLHPRQTLLVQLGATFMSRISPANLGGPATNVAYLRRAGHELADATGSVLTISMIGTIVHMLLSVTAIAVLAGGSPGWSGLRAPVWLPVAVIAGVAGVLAGLTRGQHGQWVIRRIADPIRRGVAAVCAIVAEPRRLTLTTLGSAGVTFGHLAALIACVHAFGGRISLAHVALVYLIGSAVGAATTMPGGLGAFEASTVAAFNHFGMGVGPALSATLTFRLLTYWLPIGPGFLAWRLLRRQEIL